MPDKIFIGCPSHDGRIAADTAIHLYANATEQHQIVPIVQVSSLLVENCNVLLANAVNAREAYGIKWFAMLHSDVSPEPWWIDRLIAQAELHQADFVSAVVAIKDAKGLLSTAVGVKGIQTWEPRRLTMGEVAELPETFGAESFGDDAQLLCNTGCCILRIDQPWLDLSKVHFDSPNRIIKKDNQWQVGVIPEDWYFTRTISEAGGRVMATRTIKTIHHGVADYASDVPSHILRR